MKSHLRLGIRMFAKDMRESMPLAVTFAIAVLAFLLAFAAITGFQIQ